LLRAITGGRLLWGGKESWDSTPRKAGQLMDKSFSEELLSLIINFIKAVS
jgi:hypothetical protein